MNRTNTFHSNTTHYDIDKVLNLQAIYDINAQILTPPYIFYTEIKNPTNSNSNSSKFKAVTLTQLQQDIPYACSSSSSTRGPSYQLIHDAFTRFRCFSTRLIMRFR